MMTKKVKVATLSATAAVIAALMLVYPALVTPAAAATTTTSTSSNTASATAYPPRQGVPLGGQMVPGAQQLYGFGPGHKVSVTDGQTFTLTSASGTYTLVGSATQNGTASGTVTFTVTGSLASGDALSVSGTVVVGGTTYTLSSGSAEMNPSATAIAGQGSVSPAGVFLLSASAHGSFVESNGQVSLDLSNGTTEYLVLLNGGITG